jgi:hypothetical protein
LGKKLSDCIEKTMETRQNGRLMTKRGNNGDYYGVLRGAAAVGTVGMILEHSFHINTRATNWLLDESNLAKLAKAEADVIADYYGIKAATQQENVEKKKLYRVQVGAYSTRPRAENVVIALKNDGYDAIIVESDGG